MKKLFIVILVVFAFAISKDSFSQITGSITAKGTVLTPISITSKSDLNFGTSILPGIPVTVDKSNANAGQFSLAGAPSKQINVTLTLPDNLLSGVNTMPITFSATDGSYKTPAGTLTVFNPNNPVTPTFGSEGTMNVNLGGKVSPAHTQVAGAYSASIQISLFYTGN
jgi:hypothetical protein